jgi:hypothetical protein
MLRSFFSTLISFLSLSALAVACDPTISLEVRRPGNTEAEPSVVYAKATSGCSVTLTRVYVDNKRIYEQTGTDAINARLVMGKGLHHVVIQSWNSAGAMAREDRFTTSTRDLAEPISGCDYGSEGVDWAGDHIPFATTSPIRVGMGGNPYSGRFSSIRLYIDGVNRAQTYGTTGYCLPAAFLTLKPGYHFINLEAWDSTGRIYLNGTITKVVP